MAVVRRRARRGDVNWLELGIEKEAKRARRAKEVKKTFLPFLLPSWLSRTHAL
jgi:hypothetical protein